jgi:hypothetical protein
MQTYWLYIHIVIKLQFIKLPNLLINLSSFSYQGDSNNQDVSWVIMLIVIVHTNNIPPQTDVLECTTW